ncbi:MAG: AMP-binding protein [Acidobacteria bacterium]|nr:AMP-binding protein [Acidobacteriota bacterium]TDI49044.1 MAG: long-chain fatty acid--CoA ligase [Acidobacteriota bacterium]TDI54842.1 MAG: long-chain fatty acid--CoA ligase [Acidobacteriota bacterium]
MVREWAERLPDGVAMREKDYGIWQEYTWTDVWELVQDAAHGLLALEVEVGDRVSIHSEDRPEWIILDMATIAVRAITTGLYPTNPSTEVEYLMADSGSVVHLAEDQEQADKVMEVIESLPHLRTIIHIEPRGFRKWRDDPRFLLWDDFLEMGREHRAANPGQLERVMSDAALDDAITLVYTSGTTGPPKGAMLTNTNFLFCVENLVGIEGRIPGKPPNPADSILTYLPLCHIAERIFSAWHMAGFGCTLNFAESIETVEQNLREVQPTLFFAVPRILERIHAGIIIKGKDGTWFKRVWFGFGMKLVSIIGAQRVANDGDHTFLSRLLYLIGYPIVFRALKERIGMRRVRYAAVGAAPIAPELIQYFLGMGVPLFELYGMTENSAVATCNFPGSNKVGTVGAPYPGIGLRIDQETGEIQTKHPAVFKGYWNKPEKTAEAFTEDGWLRTGDVGEWVDGTHVKIVDRMKDIIITSGGKNISPSEIENSLKTSPYIKEAMVIGDGRKYLTAVIGIELDVVGDWATRKEIPYTTYRDLSEKPEVIELVQGVVNETNKKFARVENIRKFRMIPKALDHEDGELTATQKLKRQAMTELLREIIEDMYGS